MKQSDKQLAVMTYLNGIGSVSKKDIMEALCVNRWYYANSEKHFGDLLSRMVKAVFLSREKKGYYKLKNTQRVVSIEVSENQLNLF